MRDKWRLYGEGARGGGGPGMRSAFRVADRTMSFKRGILEEAKAETPWLFS